MIVTVIVFLVVVALISAPLIMRQRKVAHDLRQLEIYTNVVGRIVKQAIEGDIPRDEALIILNAARDTYNESVQKHKNIQETSFPEVHLGETVGDRPRNETDPEGQKSEREESDRSARPDLDSNP